MLTELELAARRLQVFAEQRINPHIYPLHAPLDVGAAQPGRRWSSAEARHAAYAPVKPGWRWGPAWSTCWFQLRGAVPRSFAGRRVALLFSCGTEATLWRDDMPVHGFDVNHHSATILDRAVGGEQINLLVEAACNRPLGATLFWWDDAESRARWAEDRPGRLEQCSLAVHDDDAWRLSVAFDFVRQLLLTLTTDFGRAHDIMSGMAAIMRAIAQAQEARANDWAVDASRQVSAVLQANGAGMRRPCIAVGHAHIDTAWLWRIDETRRKCIRTFATALENLRRFPQFRFLCSQAQHYAWVQKDAPALFDRIAEAVHQGRWEPGGAMWIEPDCNVPSGESLVRQIIHGERFWRGHFGAAGRQTYLYLPDTFGFPGILPQIMRLAGLTTFITNKLCWNDTTEFPHISFRWRGIDGSEVAAHTTPGRDYNAQNTPRELLRGMQDNARLNHGVGGAWLQPFGHGDGGGGPTAESIVRAELAADCEGLPPMRMGRVDEFSELLRSELAHSAKIGNPSGAPTWDGELYLEYHRGTLTTQAWLKRANRRAEQSLRVAEWLGSVGPSTAPHAATPAHLKPIDLDETWKLVLLNQFHDILPGSSIGEVYDDARRDHERVAQTADALIHQHADRWAALADTTGMSDPIAVFNPTSQPRDAIVECAGELTRVTNVPAMGVRICDRGECERQSLREAAELSVIEKTDAAAEHHLSNGVLSVRIDSAGRIAELRSTRHDRAANAVDADGRALPLNQLVLYDDHPRYWEAWDLDVDYESIAWPVDTPAERIRHTEFGPLRHAVECTRPLGQHSRITQRFVLHCGSARLDIHTRVDWHEDRTLLRALFPTNLRARHATYDISFGAIERPTHRNTPRDSAMFEVPAHAWMDHSEPGFGLALLNNGKYGHSCHAGIMGLSLLRSSKFPDPNADMGTHEFTYALLPHDGDWRAAGLVQEAAALNSPPFARPLPAARAGAFRGQWQPFSLTMEGRAGVQVAALKPAEAADGIILRLVESHGARGALRIQWTNPPKQVTSVNVLEQPNDIAQVRHDLPTAETTIALLPFQIITLHIQ